MELLIIIIYYAIIAISIKNFFLVYNRSNTYNCKKHYKYNKNKQIFNTSLISHRISHKETSILILMMQSGSFKIEWQA